MTDDPMLELTRRLFGRDAEPTEPTEPEPATGNRAPREGNSPRTNDDPMRTYARGLFERAHHDH